MPRLKALWAALFATGMATAILGLAVTTDLRVPALGALVALLAVGLHAFTSGERALEAIEEPVAPAAAEVEAEAPVQFSTVAPGNGAGQKTEAPPGAALPDGAAGRTRGVCGKCGARLTLSDRRPVRAKCPRCGHTRTLTK